VRIILYSIIIVVVAVVVVVVEMGSSMRSDVLDLVSPPRE
jgi:hypothetical protein